MERICKVCGYWLFGEPLLWYPDMPGVAQHLPDAASAGDDRGMDLNVFQCAGCGLVQLDVDPVPYYREAIRAAGVSDEMRAMRLWQFSSFLEDHELRGRKVIEIGCGRGEYLALLREAGADAWGLEWGEEAARASTRVARGFIDSERYRIPNGPFDGFAILSFLEHLPRPLTVLRGIADNLSDGAVGIVEVPNFDMILRGRMFAEFMRDHLFYFTRRTLATTLEFGGFEVLQIAEIWHDYILSAVVRKRQRMDLAEFAAHQRRLEGEIDGFLRSHPKVAIWGAGHQAFAVMALMRLGGRIRYVVDSAPFKQGKLTPASHIPIVAPAALQSDPVDGILVMAGSYSEEIVRILRETSGAEMAIAVLRDSGLETV